MLKAAGGLAGAVLAQGCSTNAIVPIAQNAPIMPPPQRLASATVPAAPVRQMRAPATVNPRLFERAQAAMARHAGRLQWTDRIAIADFAVDSAHPRFQFIDMHSGVVSAMRVAHGSGSDPAHCGRLERFSNVPDSNATSEGAFITDNYYVGKHGRSQRLLGLDPTNDNALMRAIVVHGAWYANPEMIAQHGKLGRSQGCFAVAEGDLARVFSLLGEGRMIYAAKV
ncbi:murein L,D-transpeptidase catalytic domain family protein [Sphingomonas hankookensis]